MSVYGSGRGHRSATPGYSVWITLLVGVLFAGMLAAFYQIVLGAVQQGESLRKANAIVTEATWRCNSAPPPASSTCATRTKRGSDSGEPGLDKIAHQVANKD